ncbi:MAG: hypothetical protein K0R65_1078 [Crocinitomicaceae bacterium]|jgi:hypothetical protein|nr:hypothetical protein [Crocinitomicaceae bacterium]
MKISIPKPCHESWNDMLPEEQGRFCLKCTKTVVDFSVKSKKEITDFFREASGKVCGRFSVNQLDKKSVPALAYTYPVKHIGKFAWALYMVFGTLLFSCADKSATIGEPNVEHVKGDVVEMSDQPKIGKVKVQDSIPSKKSVKKKNTRTCAPANPEFEKGEVVIEPQVLGEVMIEEERVNGE